MDPASDPLPPHRRLVWYVETALDCLNEAKELDGFLPHPAQRDLRQMTEDLVDMLDALAGASPALGPLSAAERGVDPEADS
jgi:hypothetical protein